MKLHNTPTALELIVAVREFLQTDVMPGTSGHLSFHARVAANVLRTVERELEAADDDQWATELLRSVGAASEVDLVDSIHTAASLPDLNAVIGVLDELTRARLRVSNPDHLVEVTDDDPTRAIGETE